MENKYSKSNRIEAMNMNHQHVVLFVGPDMSGKTNIAQELSRQTSIPYFKNDTDKKQFLNPKEYFTNTIRYAEPFFTSYLKQTKSSVLLDRGYPCEWVYSKAFGRETDIEAIARTDHAYGELNAKIVVCVRSEYGNIVDDTFPDHLDGQKLNSIRELYRSFANFTVCDVMWLIVDDEDLQKQVDQVKKFIFQQVKK